MNTLFWVLMAALAVALTINNIQKKDRAIAKFAD
jgi:hypothetical protein